MNKDQFLSKLNRALKGLSFTEKQDILLDYEEHFAIAAEEGKSEEETAKKLGDPGLIAKELLASYHLEKVDNELSTGNIFRAVWAVIGLGFFNIVIVLGPFLALAGVIVGFWAVSVSFTLSPLLFLVDIALHPGTFEWFNMFASVGLCGLGILLGIGMFYVTKGISLGFVRYLKYNASLVKGGLKHESN